MEKYVPYEKLSKKKQREFNTQKRGSWGSINPVTRKPRNSKAYDRNKASQWKHELHDLPCLCFMRKLTRISLEQKRDQDIAPVSLAILPSR